MLEALTSELRVDENLASVQETLTQPARLRQQMRADALQPLSQTDNDEDVLYSPSAIKSKDRFPTQIIEEAKVFIRLNVRSYRC